MNRCLGRQPSFQDPRTVKLSDVARADAPPPPPKRYWQLPVTDWGVMGNNTHGNCVIVTAAHCLLTWRANELNDTQRLTDSAVVELSRQMGALNGYNILSRLKYWRSTGMWSDRLWGYAALNTQNHVEIKRAIDAFGAVDIGVALAKAWKNSPIWDTGSGAAYRPGSWGLHSVPFVGYDDQYAYCVTWGDVIPLTWAAVSRYCDEGYALLDSNWIAGDSTAPSGFDLPKLHSILYAVTGRGLPAPIR